MTIRRMVLQAAITNLIQNQVISVDANGLLISTGMVLGTIATQANNNVSITGGTVTGITDLAIVDGGTDSSNGSQARMSLGINDFHGRLYAAQLPTKIINSYWHGSNDERVVVAGTWAVEGDDGQTDYDPALTTSAGYVDNGVTHADNDEIHFGSLTLVAGTYKISFCSIKGSSYGILEILHGTTSLGTYDEYNGSTLYNRASSFTYSPTTTVTGNLRVKMTGKNVSSSTYRLYLSRLEIIRTG